MKTSTILKSLAATLMLGASSVFVGGCAEGGLAWDPLRPGLYQHRKRPAQWRYAAFDWANAIEDFDRDVIMIRPASHMTIWNVTHSD